MAERPPGKGGPEEGTPEYDWLYGSRGTARPDDATRMVPKQDPAGDRSGQRPDQTRMMPAQPPTSDSSGRPPGGGTRTSTAAPPPKPARSRRLPRFRFGFIKLLVDAESRAIVGATVLGVDGDEAVQSLLDVIASKRPYTEVLSGGVRIHPTVSELLPTVLQSLKPLAPPSA